MKSGRRNDCAPTRPSMAVRALDAREARSHGRQLRQSGYCVLPNLVSGDLDAWIRRRHLPRELSFYPNWKSSDFFHNADSEPPIPLSGDLEPLRALLPGIEAAASSIAGERLVCLQANATLYSAATNAQLGDHKDGSPFSVVVHVSASRPETAGLIFNEELVLFSEPGHAVLLRGDEYTHRSCAVDEGQDRLVLVFFSISRVRARGAPAAPGVGARSVIPRSGRRRAPGRRAPGGGPDARRGLRGARPRYTGKGRRLPRVRTKRGLVFREGPLERVLGRAVGPARLCVSVTHVFAAPLLCLEPPPAAAEPTSPTAVALGRLAREATTATSGEGGHPNSVCWWIFTRGHRDEERRKLTRSWTCGGPRRSSSSRWPSLEELDGRLDLAEVQAEARRDAVRVAALVARAVLRVVVQDPLLQGRHAVGAVGAAGRGLAVRRRVEAGHGVALRGAAAAPEDTWILPTLLAWT